ncbi:hypothetical protein O2K51_07345 [Apibacter raozihei]|uniref:hypothetical protein n=1 Tax=Apibacter raozihei TaxID=2500547 RepID=UPI000FE41E8D|nr:hypothetical protein [Apibacter raozihei]
MKKLILSLIFIFTAMIALSAQEVQTSFLFGKSKKYVVYESEIFEIDKKGELKSLIKFPDKVYKALLVQDHLWLGTDSGAQVFDIHTLTKLKEEFISDKIVDLTLDAEGEIWLVSLFKGVYRQNMAHVFEKMLDVITNYCITATPDGNIYVGTNLGMYNLSLKKSGFIRYAEEAHSGNGLPDNIVESLYSDNDSNVWIVMPDNIAFKKSDNYLGEIPTFSYVGNKENKLYKIVGIKDQSYLFITQQGIMLLPSGSLKEHSHNDEVFSGHDTNAFQLTNEFLGAPSSLHSEPVLFAESDGKQIYFFTQKGIWELSEKKLVKKLKNH